MKSPKRSSRWVAAAVAAIAMGGVLGGALPASAAVYSLTGSVTPGTYKYYYNTFRPHTNGYASWKLDSYDHGMAGGALSFGLWNGTGGETPMQSFNTLQTGTYRSFTWPGGGYVLPTNTYAVIDGSSGACGGPCGFDISWAATLNL